MLKLAILLLIVVTFGAAILRLLAKIFLSAAKLFCIFLGVLAGVIFISLQKLIPFLAKHLARAVPWIISAFVTAGLIIYAAGRKIFHGESISAFIKKLIPHETYGTEFSLLLIELADSIQADIVSKLKTQYETILNFFKPLNGGE